MADDRQDTKYQRMRRCHSDGAYGNKIKVLKIPRKHVSNSNKENIPIVPRRVESHNMALSHSVKKEIISERDICDNIEDELILKQLNFDKNDNDGGYESIKQENNRHITPPPSPTWNLKMLCEAVSPEIRRMQQEKGLKSENSDKSSSVPHTIASPLENGQDCLESSFVIVEEASTNADLDVFTSRKDKSLGKLCDKFLSKFPEFPVRAKNEICLDEVARDLVVERRRIYDIVNVLESVEIVSRLAKNRYMWHGKTNLSHTLVKLKLLAEKDKIAEQMQRILDQEMNCVSSFDCGEDIGGKVDCSSEESTQTIYQRKDRSLGVMSQKFLMLFLVSESKIVNLELSARLLIDDPSIHSVWTPKFKTKIRRLYDIANILSSLQLIQKVHVTEYRGRKPAFKYIGPVVDGLQDIDSYCSDGCHRPSSRHSLLDCIKNDGYELRNKLKRHMSEGSVQQSSSDEFFKVVEQERNLLFDSSSQPSSPVKKLAFEGASEQKDHKFAVPSLTRHLSFDDHQKQGSLKSFYTIPGKVIHKPKPVHAHTKQRNILFRTPPGVFCTPSPGSNMSAETIIVSSKGGEVRCVARPKTLGNMHAISNVHQDQVLQFHISKPKSSARREIQFNKPMDGTTSLGKSLLQSPDHELAILNETSPLPGTTYVQRTLKRSIVNNAEAMTLPEKHSRIELPTPPCGSTISDSLILTEEISPVSSSESKITTLCRIKSSPLSTSLESMKSRPQFIIHKVDKSSFKGSTQICVNVTPSDQICDAEMTKDSNTVLLENTQVPLTPGASFHPVSREINSSTPTYPIPIKIIENHGFSSSLSFPSMNSGNSPISNMCNMDQFSPPATPKSSPQVPTISSSNGIHSRYLRNRKVLTCSKVSSMTSNRHSDNSPFKAILPSTKDSGATTTFLVKVPSSKLSKRTSM